LRFAIKNLSNSNAQDQPQEEFCIILIYVIKCAKLLDRIIIASKIKLWKLSRLLVAEMLHRAFILLSSSSSSCGVLLMWCQIVIQAQAASSTIAHPFLQTSSNVTSVLPPIGNRLL